MHQAIHQRHRSTLHNPPPLWGRGGWGIISRGIISRGVISIIIFFLFTFLLLTSSAHAGQAVLTWDPPTTNTDGTPLTDLAGYKIYYGMSSGGYGTSIDTGNVTTYTISGLTEKVTYYFAATTYNTYGNESNNSNEVYKTIPDATPPVISSVTVSSISSNSAVITWTTDETSTSQAEYGTTTSYGFSTTVDSTMVTSHGVTLSGLSAWTTYHFRVKSQDAAGNLATSGDYTFTTLAPPDTTPPTGTISINGVASYTTSAAVTLTLSCSDSGSGCSQMRLSNDGTTWNVWESYTVSKLWTLSSSDGVKTAYVQYRDTTGNTSQSYTDTITLDTKTPVISGIVAGSITAGETTITWTTDEASSSHVEYGTSADYGGFSNLDSSPVTSHTVTLSGLTPNTVYYFRVLSNDQAGNQGTSVGYNFTTQKVAQPDTPAVIQDLTVRVGASRRNSLILDWTATGADGVEGTASAYDLRMSTQKIIEDGITPAQGEINFSTAVKINGMTAPNVAGTRESVQAGQLETNSVYSFAIKAIDDKGNRSAISNVVNADNIPPLPVTAVRQGYTMISLPLVPITLDVQTLLGGIVGTPVELYWWGSNGLGDDNGAFVADTNIVPGYGYFLKSDIENAVLNVTGTVITDASRAIPLQPGWNMIGNPYPLEVVLRNTYVRKIDTGELKSYEDAVITGWTGNAAYNFNGSTYDFELYTNAILKLWQGYWIAVLQGGQYELIIYKP
ncbi:MAG: fibronectin type III domain-containing protein [Nitrospirae bacterium]|nr:fibronectin type III domain-containing protein [Nitrospirota bacterium]